MRNSPKLLTPADYVQQATESIRAATHRVNLLTLILAEDNATSTLIDALCEAAQRGVRVSVAADTFTYTELRGNYIPTTYRSKRVREAFALQKRFKKAGVKFSWLGRLSTVAFSGRTHVKWCIVDDVVYSFGGVNLDQESVTHADYMLRVRDAPLADRLSAEHGRIINADKHGHAYRSLRFGDDTTTVLIDGGFFGDSIIYRRACYWAARAKHVTFVSQYYPSGKLSKLLTRTDSKLYFNHASNSGAINYLILQLAARFNKQVTQYTRSRYIHAKFIIFTLDDGKKVAITGSHNFVRAGVFLGTREVALETTDKKIIAQLEKFLTNHIR